MKKSIIAIAPLLLFLNSASASVTFNDTYSDKLQREILSAGKFSLRAVIPLLESDSPLSFDRDTPVRISIGTWQYEGVLGDDPRFVPGRSRSARLPLAGGAVSLAASRKGFTASITSKTGSSLKGDTFESSPAAAGQYSEETKKLTVADGVLVDVSIEVGGVKAVSQIPLSGSVRYALKKIGKGETAEEFGLCSVKIGGKSRTERVSPE